jgi:hypothetical protein
MTAGVVYKFTVHFSISFSTTRTFVKKNETSTLLRLQQLSRWRSDGSSTASQKKGRQLITPGGLEVKIASTLQDGSVSIEPP